jgi:hypothetical protein
VLVAAFGVWTLRSVEPGRAGLMVGAAVVGAIAALVPTLVYNIAIYGGVFHAGLEQPAVMPEGAAILSWPSPSRLLGLLFGGFRGLLWVAPLIVIVPLGYWVSFRRIARPAWWLLLGLPVAQLVLIAGYAYAWGGWSTGPRFLVPALPFLWLPLAFLWQRAGEGPRLTLAGCSLVGACAALTAASVSMASPTPYPNPMLSYVLPLFAGGFIRNALTLAGGRGFPTLVALPVLWLAAAAVVAALAGRAVAVVDAAPRPQAAPPSRKQAAARNR